MNKAKYIVNDLVKNKLPPFPKIEPFKTGFLEVSEIHKIYYEISGNPSGKTALYIHGGPGAGSIPFFRQYFDSTAYQIIQFDQRGCGKSTPSNCLKDNTTWDSVADIEKLRKHLNVDKWHTVSGGSWGSTLALAYAETHPECVGHLLLRGVFLLRREEIQFFYQDGASWIFPEFFDELQNKLPKYQQADMLHNYHRILTTGSEQQKLDFATAWTKWEMATSRLIVDPEYIAKGDDPKFALEFATIETHYFINGGFFEPNQLLENAHKIKHIPTWIVGGRYDVVCPIKSAWDLYQKLDNCVLCIVPDAGHSGSEEGIIDGLVKGSEEFKKEQEKRGLLQLAIMFSVV